MKFEVKNRLKPCALISAVIIVIALVMSMMGMGMNLGIDFTGGTLMTYNMGSTFTTADVTAALEACGYRCKTAIVMLLCGVAAQEAEAMLERAGGRIAGAVARPEKG